jgi:hypothetical protein
MKEKLNATKHQANRMFRRRDHNIETSEFNMQEIQQSTIAMREYLPKKLCQRE